MTMRGIGVVLAAFTVIGCMAMGSATSLADDVADLEAIVQMPPEAGTLHSFDRYYWRDGSRVIGEYRAGRGSIHFNKPSSVILDGGCGVVHIDYEPARKRIISVACNGVA